MLKAIEEQMKREKFEVMNFDDYCVLGNTVSRLRAELTALKAERDAAITNLRVEQIAHLSLTDLLEKENVQLKSALKVARDGIDEFLVANDPTEFGCACDLSVGYLCGPCHADMQQQPLKSAIAKTNEVLK